MLPEGLSVFPGMSGLIIPEPEGESIRSGLLNLSGFKSGLCRGICVSTEPDPLGESGFNGVEITPSGFSGVVFPGIGKPSVFPGTIGPVPVGLSGFMSGLPGLISGISGLPVLGGITGVDGIPIGGNPGTCGPSGFVGLSGLSGRSGLSGFPDGGNVGLWGSFLSSPGLPIGLMHCP